MNDTTANGNYIELTAEIVSAYVSNNTVAAGDIPGLINQVHAALARVSGEGGRGAGRAAEAGGVGEKIDHARTHRLSRGRQEIQVAQAPFAHAVQHDAGAIPGKMEPGADYPMVAPNYAAARSQLAKQMGLGQQRRRRAK